MQHVPRWRPPHSGPRATAGLVLPLGLRYQDPGPWPLPLALTLGHAPPSLVLPLAFPSSWPLVFALADGKLARGGPPGPSGQPAPRGCRGETLPMLCLPGLAPRLAALLTRCGSRKQTLLPPTCARVIVHTLVYLLAQRRPVLTPSQVGRRTGTTRRRACRSGNRRPLQIGVGIESARARGRAWAGLLVLAAPHWAMLPARSHLADGIIAAPPGRI